MIAVDHLLSDGRGSQPVTVTVCRTYEAADPDFNRLRSAGGLPFEALAGARLALTAGAGDERALQCMDRARRLLTAAGDVERGEWT